MKTYLIGSGAHAGAVIASIRRAGIHNVIGIIDETLPHGSQRFGYRTIGAAPTVTDAGFFIAIGNNAVRRRLAETVGTFVDVVDDTCCGSHPVARGRYFGAHSYIGQDCFVGEFVILNTGVILEHHSTVGAFSHLAPGVVTGGHVKIGSNVLIGMNATIRDGITIGNNCVIGMGSVVTGNVPDNSVAWGNPCRPKR